MVWLRVLSKGVGADSSWPVIGQLGREVIL